ncbi:hypothetical protein ACOMICROBIO_NCLOACGD_00161 [Vibrio sp. B1ASS3]|uniref:hypothetical protein n=1 Tax=Vibrio sp. B1ASS3 TaxID=2751176 RepID=UPI001ABA20AD|nr:hypothetical protein [Vibrio sp. B1ASS3]CAD7797294.1 hypothetical protein ACOMICROBIO_NCLOACGD_00161 [Vibrio sp. B1ASS3]CAE6879507.1 hypothetical protein ACOMICROBIO_NCLOACGD_00161 [Vibrio sp. B1ASS3]
MARSAKKIKRGFTETLDKKSIENNRIVSIIRLDGLFIFLDKKGLTISYTKLNQDQEGKTSNDADQCTEALLETSKVNPFFNLGKNTHVRPSAIEAIESINGKDYKGIIIRGEEDAILSFLPVPLAEKRDLAVTQLHAAMESFEAGKFVQPDLAGIL